MFKLRLCTTLYIISYTFYYFNKKYTVSVCFFRRVSRFFCQAEDPAAGKLRKTGKKWNERKVRSIS